MAFTGVDSIITSRTAGKRARINFNRTVVTAATIVWRLQQRPLALGAIQRRAPAQTAQKAPARHSLLHALSALQLNSKTV